MDDLQQEPQDELQDDVQLSDEATETELTEGEESQDEKPEGDSQEKQKIFNDDQQKVVDKIVNKNVGKLHEERRKREEAERKLAEAQSQIPQKEAPVIPDMPNPDDFIGDKEGFDVAMKERDEAIVESAKFDADIEANEAAQQELAQRQERERALKLEASIKDYEGNAESFGIKPEEMREEAKLVSDTLRSPDISDHITSDPQGPLVVKYLAQNPLALDKLRTMTPIQAALHVDKEIKPNLAGMTKQTQAPNPPDIIDGQGAPEKEHPALEGAEWK